MKNAFHPNIIIKPVVIQNPLVYFIIFFLATSIFSVAFSSNLTLNEIDQNDPITLEDLAITLSPSDSQEFILTDNNATHYTMETSKLEKRKWQGLVHRDYNYITNVWFSTDDTYLDETTIAETTILPYSAKYTYNNGATEELFLPEDSASLVIEFKAQLGTSKIKINPSYAMRIDYYASSGISDYEVSTDGDCTLYVKTADTKWIALVTNEMGVFNDFRQLRGRYFEKDHLRRDGSGYENLFFPGNLEFNATALTLVASIAETKEEAKQNANNILNDLEKVKNVKIDRLKKLMDSLAFDATMFHKGEGINLQQSFAQALLSLDKLKMKRFGVGTYAGLHWFDDYWGRDSFISFRGTSLLSANWDFAKSNIETMAKLQLNDSSRYEFGRVPNRVAIEDSSPDYTTSDGTGWFVKAIGDYIKTTGDVEFAAKMYPHMKLAINGEQTRTDSIGFVTHKARETWMDAYTNGVVQTPRDDRAIEIQALLYQIYDNTIYVGELLGEEISNITNLKELRDNLLKNIKASFWNSNSSMLYDHLNSDGTPDLQLRPNQFLALSLLPDNFLSESEKNNLVESSMPLITSYGIRTLDPDDPNYKPTHDGGAWHHDQAYHNGDVWPWLSGAAIELLIQTDHKDLATGLIYNLHKQTLNYNPVGGLGEVFDGDSTGDAQSVAALLQLWSMAEYLRSLAWSMVGYEANGNEISFTDYSLDIMRNYSTTIPNHDKFIQYKSEKDIWGYQISITEIPDSIQKIILKLPAFQGQTDLDINGINDFKNLSDENMLILEIVNTSGSLEFTVDAFDRPLDTQSESSNNGGSSYPFLLTPLVFLIRTISKIRRRNKS